MISLEANDCQIAAPRLIEEPRWNGGGETNQHRPPAYPTKRQWYPRHWDIPPSHMSTMPAIIHHVRHGSQMRIYGVSAIALGTYSTLPLAPRKSSSQFFSHC